MHSNKSFRQYAKTKDNISSHVQTFGTCSQFSADSISMSTTCDINTAANRLFRPNTSAETDQFQVNWLKENTPTARRLLPTQPVSLCYKQQPLLKNIPKTNLFIHENHKYKCQQNVSFNLLRVKHSRIP